MQCVPPTEGTLVQIFRLGGNQLQSRQGARLGAWHAGTSYWTIRLITVPTTPFYALLERLDMEGVAAIYILNEVHAIEPWHG